jgi:hypothetical protein
LEEQNIFDFDFVQADADFLVILSATTVGGFGIKGVNPHT